MNETEIKRVEAAIGRELTADEFFRIGDYVYTKPLGYFCTTDELLEALKSHKIDKPLHVAIMAGHNIAYHDAPSDMVSYRNRLIFRDTAGVIAFGDIFVWTKRKYNAKGKAAGIVNPCATAWDMGRVKDHIEKRHGKPDMAFPMTFRYTHPVMDMDGQCVNYQQADILAAVNRMTGANYTRVVFHDDYSEWEKADGVAGLLAAYRAQEEREPREVAAA